MASWLRNWGRSPRQDRRVVIDGKFVELAPVAPPVVEPAEVQESALEIVNAPTEATDGEAGSTGADVRTDNGSGPATEEAGTDRGLDSGLESGSEPSVVRASYSIPAEAEVIHGPEDHEHVAKTTTGLYAYAEAAEKGFDVPPVSSEGTTSPDLLDGAAGSVETIEDTPPEVTLADVDKAIASIPKPVTYEDYTKTYTVHPGGSVTENKS